MTKQMQAIKDREPAVHVMSLAPAVKLLNNRPYLRCRYKTGWNDVAVVTVKLPSPIRFEKFSMETETRKQSTPPLSVDCSQKFQVRLKSCLCQSSIVSQRYSTYAVSDEDAIGTFETENKYYPDLRSLFTD